MKSDAQTLAIGGPIDGITVKLTEGIKGLQVVGNLGASYTLMRFCRANADSGRVECRKFLVMDGMRSQGAKDAAYEHWEFGYDPECDA